MARVRGAQTLPELRRVGRKELLRETQEHTAWVADLCQRSKPGHSVRSRWAAILDFTISEEPRRV